MASFREWQNFEIETPVKRGKIKGVVFRTNRNQYALLLRRFLVSLLSGSSITELAIIAIISGLFE